jgi:guanylate kinase
MNKQKGRIYVITGPSGVGKTEIGKSILNNKELELKKAITCTTRSKRKGEKDGVDYFFLTKEEFIENIKKDKMFEFAEVYGNYYGSRKKDIEKILNSGKNILFIVDVVGALSLKKLDKGCITIFIKAENPAELKRRLIGRNTDSVEIIKGRLKTALAELKLENKFDKIVINPRGKVKEAIERITKIILQS